jgi:hypothetical protein
LGDITLTLRKRVVANRVALGLVIFLLILFPVFFRMNFSQSNFNVTDFLDMIGPNAFPYLIALCLCVGFYLFTLSKKSSTFIVPLVIVLIFFSMFTASQYPALSDKDYLLHGRLDTILLSTGHLPSVSEKGNYYVEWPGAFLLRTQTSLLVGVSELDSARFLSFIFPVLFVFFLYILAKDKLGPFLGGLVPVLFLVSNIVYTTDEIDHFCPQLLALTLFVLTIYLATRDFDKKTANVTTCLIVLFSLAIIISHPITPFFLLPALLSIWLFNAYIKRRGGKSTLSLVNFLLVCLVFALFITWSVFSAGQSFAQGVSQIASFENPSLSSQVQIYHYPTQFLVNLSYYWKVLAVVILVPSLYLVVRIFRGKGNDDERKLSSLCWILLGVGIGGLAFSVTSLVDFTRVLTFLLIPACLLTVYLAAKYVNKTLISIFLILLIIPGFLTIYSFSGEYQYYQHPFELTAAQWLSKENANNQFVSSDYDTMIVYSYYDWHSWPGGIVGDEEVTNYSLPVSFSHPFFKGDFMIRSIRQDILKMNSLDPAFTPGAEYWSKIDNYADSHYNLIYSNEFIRIYGKVT